MPEPTVYATAGGQRYHRTPDCPRLAGGQALWDTDEWVLGMHAAMLHGGYSIHEETAQHAAMRGRTPCLVCRPPLVQMPLYGQTFGHVPYFYDGVDICQRCWVPSGPFSAHGHGTTSRLCAENGPDGTQQR